MNFWPFVTLLLCLWIEICCNNSFFFNLQNWCLASCSLCCIDIYDYSCQTWYPALFLTELHCTFFVHLEFARLFWILSVLNCFVAPWVDIFWKLSKCKVVNKNFAAGHVAYCNKTPLVLCLVGRGSAEVTCFHLAYVPYLVLRGKKSATVFLLPKLHVAWKVNKLFLLPPFRPFQKYLQLCRRKKKIRLFFCFPLTNPC